MLKSYTDGYYEGECQLQPGLSNSKVCALIYYVYDMEIPFHGTLYDATKMYQIVWIYTIVSLKNCLVLPEAFFSAIRYRKVNLLLGKVHLCASSGQLLDLHVLMIYNAYKSWHPVRFLLAK